MEPSEIKYNRELWLKLFDSPNPKLRMTDVGVYSITHPYMAIQFSIAIATTMREIGLPLKTATDCTGGLGGMARFLCLFFDKVTVVEKNVTHFEMCKSNIQVLSGGRNVAFVNASAIEYLERMQPQDLMFCDPPWGGYGYKVRRRNSLYLDGQNICDIVCMTFKRGLCKVFAMMAMINYDFTDLDKLDEDIVYKILNVRNVYLICFHKKIK